MINESDKHFGYNFKTGFNTHTLIHSIPKIFGHGIYFYSIDNLPLGMTIEKDIVNQLIDNGNIIDNSFNYIRYVTIPDSATLYCEPFGYLVNMMFLSAIHYIKIHTVEMYMDSIKEGHYIVAYIDTEVVKSCLEIINSHTYDKN